MIIALFDLILLAAGWITGLGLTLIRYHGLGHGLLLCLAASGLSACAAMILLRYLPIKHFVKFAIVAIIASICVVLAVNFFIGFDGIVPRPSGTQSVGLGVVSANPDLFALAIATPIIAFRRAFGL